MRQPAAVKPPLVLLRYIYNTPKYVLGVHDILEVYTRYIYILRSVSLVANVRVRHNEAKLRILPQATGSSKLYSGVVLRYIIVSQLTQLTAISLPSTLALQFVSYNTYPNHASNINIPYSSANPRSPFNPSQLRTTYLVPANIVTRYSSNRSLVMLPYRISKYNICYPVRTYLVNIYQVSGT